MGSVSCVKGQERGKWTADKGGNVIKLTVGSCNNGYSFKSGGNTTSNPVVAKTTILFHTGNNSDFVGVVGNTGFIPNRCYGWGWAYSMHACRQVAGVYVCPDPTNRTKFEFWVSLYGYSGAPLVEASTTAVWERSVTAQASLPSTGYVPLQVATASTTLTPGNTYTNNPPTLPVAVL